MARLSEQEINEIRAQADIVDVISRYEPLTRKGKNYWCTCPFHDDHDPSMSVNEDKQIFKCFVCGAGGNVFSFVQRYEQVSFVEAVAKVADYAGILFDRSRLESTSKPIDPYAAKLHKIHQDMIEFTCYELDAPRAVPVKEYLHKRGLSDEIIKKFELGYNPPDNEVYHFLHAKKHSDEDLIAANVARMGSMGMYDVFTNRITIPIHDEAGKPVGFSARRIKDNDDAKYINTSETKIYIKGNLIFNYHRAKPECKKSGKAILVEGAMDVLAFEKAGMHNAIATLGTACTKAQLKLMKRLNVPLVVCYDGDQAGQNATYKLGMMINNLFPFEIVENKVGLDPDEIIEVYGLEELKKMSERTISWIDFLFQYLSEKYNLENYSQKKAFAQEMADAIASMPNDFEKANHYMRLLQLTGFDMRQTVKEEPPQHAPKKQAAARRNYLTYPKDGALLAQHEILSQMLCGIAASNVYRDELGFMEDDTCNQLAIYMIDYYRTHTELIVAELLDLIKEEKVKDLLLEIANWELAREEIDMIVLRDDIKRCKSSLLDNKIRKLNEQIMHLHDPIQKAVLADEKNRLIRERGGILNEENR